MKQANRIILIAIAAIAMLTVPATSFAKERVGLRAGVSRINYFAHGRHPPYAATLSQLKSNPDSYF